MTAARARLRLWAFAVAALAGDAHADGLATALPHVLYVGAPRGVATARDIDARHTRRAPRLPLPDTARVAWRRRLPGGISGNVLIDELGRAFIPGLGRVTQLDASGASTFSAAAPFSSTLAAALASDGTRAVLTREGHVLGWSAAGTPAFDIALDAPAPAPGSTLLGLPDGGLVLNVERWLFEIDASHELRAHASLPAAIEHLLVVQERCIAIDQRGRVFEWDLHGAPRLLGRFAGPLLGVLADADALVGVSARRGLEQLALEGGEPRPLARFDAGGGEPVLGLFEPGRWALLRPDGSWISAGSDAGARGPNTVTPAAGLTRLDLLTSADGAVAWWAADTALRIESSPGVGRELPDVRCSSPVSLVPAGSERILAACASGTIWLIGPAAAAPAGPASRSPAATPQQSGISSEGALYSRAPSRVGRSRPPP